ncbi:hypothetical protein [Psychrobacter sp. CAL346-MNA-CIBAN-0220]
MNKDSKNYNKTAKKAAKNTVNNSKIHNPNKILINSSMVHDSAQVPA